MSWFSSSSTGENLHPPTEGFTEDTPLFGPLVPEDTMWHCSTSIITETQVRSPS